VSPEARVRAMWRRPKGVWSMHHTPSGYTAGLVLSRRGRHDTHALRSHEEEGSSERRTIKGNLWMTRLSQNVYVERHALDVSLFMSQKAILVWS